jgi:DNA-binding MarR family transcriptional regulator
MSTRRTVRDLDVIVETVIYLQSESRRLAREQCQKLGITATQLNVIKMLDEIGDLSLSELSRRMASQNSTVTGIVDRMVQAGLVAREQSAEDRRVWRIRLADKGKQLAKKIDVAPWDILRRAVDALDKKERAELTSVLRKLAAHIAKEIQEESR